MRVLIIFFLSALASSCTTNSGDVGISAGTISSKSDGNKVFVNKNSFMTTMDTHEIALDHCLKYGKRPELVRKASAFDFWMQDEYDCVIE